MEKFDFNNISLKDLIKDYSEKYENDYKIKAINALIILEVNGNSILRDNKVFLDERHLLSSYVDSRLKEGFNILSFDIVFDEKCIILERKCSKDNIILRIWW